MKVALYLRVSTLEQAESGYSLEEQEDKLRKYCEARDWDVVHVYRDPGFSGSSLDRPSISQMLADVKAGIFEGVLVYKLDRLSRSQKDTLYIIEDVFNKYNVSFISMSENFDTSTPFGKAMIGILSVFAQLEREQIKERMQMGKVGRAKAGKAMNWSNVPFGYRYDSVNDTYDIDEFQAAIVKRIFADYLAGKPITKIHNELNEEGHLGKKVPWSHRTIRQILDNRTYTGVNVFKGEIYPALHKPIIDAETFERTKREISRRQQVYAESGNPRPFQSQYMLSGLIRCGYCGAIYIILTRGGKHETPYHIYRCESIARRSATNIHRDHCPAKRSYKRLELEKIVIDEIRNLQVNPDLIDKYKVETFDPEPLKKELERIRSQQDKLVDLYLNSGSLPLDKLQEKSDELERQRKKIEQQINNTPTPALSVDEAKEILDTDDVTKLEYDRQKVIVRQLVSGISITNDDFKIKWSFSL